ncbi:MAG: pirin family protein [Bacteroidetes bacterium]|nr:MAG: pirin family protein [Bacteroidota bacterium]
MKTILHPAGERGHANHGWLDAHHSFSFASWYNPAKMHFGLLRVLNDDTIAAGMGFGKHPHDNMEIVTIPLSGVIKHADSTGGAGEIKAGEVQIMSAGSGIEHSEFNGSNHEELKLFQVWVFPKEKNIKPRYDQREFGEDALKNNLKVLVSPDAADNALWINQDAFFSMGKFDREEELNYTMKRKGNGAFVMVVEGGAAIDGKLLGRRDAIGVYDTESFTAKLQAGTQVLVIEVPMN